MSSRIGRLLRDSIIIQTPGTVEDAYNNVSVDWITATQQVVRASVQPDTTFEDASNRADRDQVEATYRVYLPSGVTVTAYDRVLWNDGIYEVAGDPEPWQMPGSRTEHIKIRIRRVSG